MEIETIVAPNWIYDFSDYQQMYDLTASDLSKNILDFASRISSFNAQAYLQGVKVTSVDPLYGLSYSQLCEKAAALLADTVAQLEADPARLKQVSADHLSKVGSLWEKTEKTFLSDFLQGVEQGRYQASLLPNLPYKANEFKLALCTDFIFHHALPRKTVQETLMELARVAEEVRIFPLLDDKGKMPDELGPLMLYFQQKNYGIEVREVAYQTLTGGNAMLRIWEQECHL